MIVKFGEKKPSDKHPPNPTIFCRKTSSEDFAINFFKVSGQFLNFHELFPPFYIGAIYSHKIMEREYIENFSPIEHEMVFKVDLSSFDNIRSCCSHHNGCEKCWHFIATSLELLSLIIQKNLGFKKNHLL